ncbi:unnamed protein product [Dovyalis caffra]|uniref:Uncharacterized protein n=1 Tax=Dovyalis caffra TaxID=77055 RepID=A0AAV1QR61_9ROSI|nr:unnamed protein product [Dovyalis caffra]
MAKGPRQISLSQREQEDKEGGRGVFKNAELREAGGSDDVGSGSNCKQNHHFSVQNLASGDASSIAQKPKIS